MPEMTASADRGDQDARDGSVPTGPTGVGVGAGEPSTFEPEEDPEAAAQRSGAESEKDDSGDAGGAST